MRDFHRQFSGVPGVLRVLANTGAGLRRNTSIRRGVLGVLAGPALEHLEHLTHFRVFRANPHGIRLEHMEHLEHHKKAKGIGVPRPENCPRSANRQGDSMTARVSGLMARLKVAGFRPPLKKVEIGECLLRNVQAARPVTTPVTTPATIDPEWRASSVALSSCGQCAMRRAPGATWPGYCVGREDLPLAYGLLHVLPGDLGGGCPEYRPRGGPDKT